MRWLVLADGADSVAQWAFERLRAALAVPGMLVTVEDLALSSWDYPLGDGHAAVVRLAGGHALDARILRWALNRLSLPPANGIARLGPDAPYAQAEWHALLLAWLKELGAGVVNQPRPPSLSGPLLAHTEWLALASQAGYATPPLALSTRGVSMAHVRPVLDIWIVGEESFASATVPPAAIRAARRLAQIAEATLLRIGVDEDFRFVSADAKPDLRIAGDAVIALLVGHAQERLR